jgi:uncharacterized membrane protein YgcG
VATEVAAAPLTTVRATDYDSVAVDTSITPLRVEPRVALRAGRPLMGLALGLAVAVLLVGPSVSEVRAEDIPRLTGTVTDTTGVLSGDEDRIEDAAAALLEDYGVQLFVVFVNTTEDLNAPEFATETAAQNSLGGDDALLVVAVEDRTDAIWVADGLSEITDAEIDEVIVDALEPRLRDGDFAGAVVAAAEALGTAVDTAAPTAVPATPPPAQGGGGTADGDGGIGLGTILALGLIVGGGAIVWSQWRKRRTPAGGAATSPATAPVDAKDLARRANALLIATDERIRDAAQETDFAEAQYGAEAVATFRAAVAEARDDLAAAFTVRQRLDDATPEDEPTRIAMLREIVERTTKAQERLDAETERIRALRDLERDAPNTLVELPARIEAVEDRLDGIAPTVHGLEGYAETVWRPIHGNLEEARKGLAGARTAVTAGSTAVATGDLGDVAVATRTALEGMTGAAALLDAIERTAAAVADAERRIPEELAAAERDLADAAAALAGRATEPAAAGRLTASRAALDAARAASDARPPDPVTALRLATEAHRLGDEALLAARDAAAEADRLRAAAESSVRTAAAELDRAATYIESRRRGVGEVARTRLAEAQRHLTEASGLLGSDPARALESGRRAQALAQEAYRLAQDDFSDWDQGGPGWGQRRGSGGDQTADILGQILGGVIGGVIAGAGRSGGGWGGSPWGGGGGGLGGGWGGGGGFGSGGFGGGGGGRARGGRW